MYRDQENHVFGQDSLSAPCELSDTAGHIRKRHAFFLKGAALVLCCCLLGGGAGAGAVWLAGNVAFVIYDIGFSKLIAFYISRVDRVLRKNT